MSKAFIAKINAQIAALQAKITPEIQAAADAEVDLSTAVAGAYVEATYGRGEKARSIVGKLKGVKQNEKVTVYKIEVGEGADAEFINVFGSQITKLVNPPSESATQAAE